MQYKAKLDDAARLKKTTTAIKAEAEKKDTEIAQQADELKTERGKVATLEMEAARKDDRIAELEARLVVAAQGVAKGPPAAALANE